MASKINLVLIMAANKIMSIIIVIYAIFEFTIFLTYYKISVAMKICDDNHPLNLGFK